MYDDYFHYLLRGCSCSLELMVSCERFCNCLWAGAYCLSIGFIMFTSRALSLWHITFSAIVSNYLYGCDYCPSLLSTCYYHYCYYPHSSTHPHQPQSHPQTPAQSNPSTAPFLSTPHYTPSPYSTNSTSIFPTPTTLSYPIDTPSSTCISILSTPSAIARPLPTPTLPLCPRRMMIAIMSFFVIVAILLWWIIGQIMWLSFFCMFV